MNSDFGTQRMSGDDVDQTVVLRTFTVLLALAEIGHLLQRGGDLLPFRVVAFTVAVWSLARPGIRPLVALLAAIAVELVTDLPDPFNHTLVLGVTGGAVAVAWVCSRNRSWTRDPTAFLAHVGPLLRVVIVLTWLLAWFAKLNHGFFEPGSSCAVWVVGQVPGLSVPTALTDVVVTATLITELAVPVLLIVRRTRAWGVALAWAFHVIAALAGHTAFSGLAWPFYLLFLDAGLVAAAVHALGRRVPAAVRDHDWIRRPEPWVLVWMAVVGLDLAIGSVSGAWGSRLHRFVPLVGFLVVVAATTWAVGGEVLRRRRSSAAVAGPAPLRIGVLGIVVVGVLVVNAMSPYVGLKSMWSLTMYSNLRTEPGHWNHLVVPEAVRVFDWQGDLVRVDGASDEEVASELGLGWPARPAWVPAREIAQVADRHPGADVVVDGATQPLAVVTDRTVMSPLRPLVNLRAVPTEPRCQV